MSDTPEPGIRAIWLIMVPGGRFITLDPDNGAPLVRHTRPSPKLLEKLAEGTGKARLWPVRFEVKEIEAAFEAPPEAAEEEKEEAPRDPGPGCQCPACRIKKVVGEILNQTLPGVKVDVRLEGVKVEASPPRCKHRRTLGGIQCEKPDHGDVGVHIGRGDDGVEVVW